MGPLAHHALLLNSANLELRGREDSSPENRVRSEHSTIRPEILESNLELQPASIPAARLIGEGLVDPHTVELAISVPKAYGREIVWTPEWSDRSLFFQANWPSMPWGNVTVAVQRLPSNRYEASIKPFGCGINTLN